MQPGPSVAHEGPLRGLPFLNEFHDSTSRPGSASIPWRSWKNRRICHRRHILNIFTIAVAVKTALQIAPGGLVLLNAGRCLADIPFPPRGAPHGVCSRRVSIARPGNPDLAGLGHRMAQE